MTKRTKLLSTILIILLGGVVLAYFFFNQSDLISEEEAKGIVTERYGGTVESVSLDNDKRYFNINLNNAGVLHEVKIDREDSSVEAIENVSDTTKQKENVTEDSQESEETSESEEKNTEQASKQPEEKDKEKASKPKPITLEEAKKIAFDEVGGENVYSTWYEEGEAREYYILQLVDGDDEGALISVNGLTGQIYKVVWLEIDDDDYGDIEQLIYEVNEYSNMSPQRYIEYDEDYLDDYEENEEEEDGDNE